MGKRKFYGIVAKILIAVLLIPILVMLDGNAISVQAAPKKYYAYYSYTKDANGDYSWTGADSLKVNWFSGNGGPRNYTLSNIVPTVKIYYDYFEEDKDLMIVLWNQENTGSSVTNPGMNTYDTMNFENVFGITEIESYNLSGITYPVGYYSAMASKQFCNAYNITVEFMPLIQEGLVYSYYKVTSPHEEPSASENNTTSGNNTNPGNTTSGNNTNPGNTTSGNNTNPGNTTSGNNTDPGNTTSGNNTKPEKPIKGHLERYLPEKPLSIIMNDTDLVLYYLLVYDGQKYLIILTGEDARKTPLIEYKGPKWLSENFGMAVITKVDAGTYYIGTKAQAREILKKLGIKDSSGGNPGVPKPSLPGKK